MKATLSDPSFKKLNQLTAPVRKANGKSIQIGVLGGSYEDGMPIAMVALFHEHGVNGKMPKRAFMTLAFQSSQRSLKQKAKSLFLGRENMQGIGKWYQQQMKNAINNGSYAALSASTITKKGHSKPLIDTETLINAIDSQIS